MFFADTNAAREIRRTHAPFRPPSRLHGGQRRVNPSMPVNHLLSEQRSIGVAFTAQISAILPNVAYYAANCNVILIAYAVMFLT